MDEYRAANLGDRFEPFDDGSLHRQVGRSKAKVFTLTPFADIRLSTAPAYIVKGLVPRVGLVVFWGPPKCGKSFVVFDLTMHIALGWSYRERRVQKGAVVYLALEGADGFRARAEAFRQHHDLDAAADVPFYLVAMPIALAADAEALIASIRMALGQVAPSAIVVDTLNRSIAGSESDDRDMSAYVQAADRIRDAFGCAVIVVHHCGIDATRPRGHTSLTGAADAQLAVKRDAADNIVVETEWMKDGPAGEVLTCRLESIKVGTDDDGDNITSCVVVPVEGSNAPLKANAAARLTKGAKIAQRALHEAVDEQGFIPAHDPHIPRDVRCVSVAAWRAQAIKRGISTSDVPNAVRMAFNRSSEGLVAAGQVGIWDDVAWPIATKERS